MAERVGFELRSPTESTPLFIILAAGTAIVALVGYSFGTHPCSDVCHAAHWSAEPRAFENARRVRRRRGAAIANPDQDPLCLCFATDNSA
jgi:hypothetical protein